MKYRAIFLLVFYPLFVTPTFYDFSAQSVSGTAISFSDFKGKKVLIVNVALKSKYRSQLPELVQLQKIYGDSLVVLAFPSNSFGNENETNIQIRDSINQYASAKFLWTQKIEVSGTNINPLYTWLTDISKNGKMGNVILGDFQKFLINAQGDLVGIFAPSVGPLSDEMQYAIKIN